MSNVKTIPTEYFDACFRAEGKPASELKETSDGESTNMNKYALKSRRPRLQNSLNIVWWHRDGEWTRGIGSGVKTESVALGYSRYWKDDESVE